MESTKTTYQFQPSQDVRSLNLNQCLIGKSLKIRLQHTNNGSQYVSTDVRVTAEFSIHLNGWINKILGGEGSKTTMKVKDAYLERHSNGGRTPRMGERRRTYDEYFDDEARNLVIKDLSGGIMGAIFGAGRGDIDRADIIVEFDNGFKIDSMQFDIHYPYEWYSDHYKDNNLFLFVDGFYEDAQAAIKTFGLKSHDDMFGERYFPVAVLPMDVDEEKLQNILWRPKSTSNIIVKDDQIIFGTRCKPHEYEEVIDAIYEAGGKVPIGVEYSW